MIQSKFYNWSKIIMHVDMNAFFASIEQRDKPYFRGQPVAITNGAKGSCIITCSYEARAFGVKTGMRFIDAKNKCPGLLRCTSDPQKYTKVSSKIMKILYDISPDIEIFSVDEAFLDLTRCKKIYSSPLDAAYIVKDRLFRSLNLPCSIGISTNKSNAKFAAKMKKPDGITVMHPSDSESILSKYSVKDLCGVSNGIQSFLNYHGVFICGDMKNIPISILGNRFGNIGRKIWLMAQGKDIEELKLHVNAPKSLGHGKVTAPNLKNEYDIKKILHLMSEKVARRMRQNGYESNVFLISIRKKNDWVSKKYRIINYTNHGQDIFKLCLQLVNNDLIKGGIYQVQITATNPRPIGIQNDLFLKDMSGKSCLDSTIDKVNKKFGSLVLQPARLLKKLDSPDVISPSWRPNGYKKSV